MQMKTRIRHFVCVCLLSCSVMSNSLRPRGLLLNRLLCPRNFPGKNTECVAISYSKRSFRLRDRTHFSCISCTGRQILYYQCHLRSHRDTATCILGCPKSRILVIPKAKKDVAQQALSFIACGNTNWHGPFERELGSLLQK